MISNQSLHLSLSVLCSCPQLKLLRKLEINNLSKKESTVAFRSVVVLGLKSCFWAH